MQEQVDKLMPDCFVPLHADSLHDLVSPVNQIATMFELFLTRRRKQPPGDDEMVLDLIQGSTLRLRNMINALQDYYRVTSITSEPRSCDGNALLTAATASLDSLIRHSGAELTQDELPRIHCDPSQMIYVFSSLIENAIKFRGDDPPEIRISAVAQDGRWLFSVRDNGIGIEPRHWEAVFHMFKRVHCERYPGAGAGLAIARRIIERHRGCIWVESEAGHGSTFFFTLPCGGWQTTCLS